MTAGKIQANLRQRLTIFGKLADLGWVDFYLVGAEVAREFRSIRPRGLDQMRHMALGAGELHAQVGGILLLPGFVWMALFALEI